MKTYLLIISFLFFSLSNFVSAKKKSKKKTQIEIQNLYSLYLTKQSNKLEQSYTVLKPLLKLNHLNDSSLKYWPLIENYVKVEQKRKKSIDSIVATFPSNKIACSQLADILMSAYLIDSNLITKELRPVFFDFFSVHFKLIYTKKIEVNKSTFDKLALNSNEWSLKYKNCDLNDNYLHNNRLFIKNTKNEVSYASKLMGYVHQNVTFKGKEINYILSKEPTILFNKPLFDSLTTFNYLIELEKVYSNLFLSMKPFFISKPKGKPLLFNWVNDSISIHNRILKAKVELLDLAFKNQDHSSIVYFFKKKTINLNLYTLEQKSLIYSIATNYFGLVKEIKTPYSLYLYVNQPKIIHTIPLKPSKFNFTFSIINAK